MDPKPNRLATEKSPYLLQHQQNPVNWFPWCDDAFSKARAENKPIFLSIGYSTCHWCHVMERESFENPDTAAFLNDHFVSIKVDREERPDVDNLYMTFVQLTTGQGGWPMSVFLTSDRLPFFGGTYFPPEARYGKPAFLDVLREIHRAWQERRADLANAAGELSANLNRLATRPRDRAGLSDKILKDAVARIKQSYDPEHGGFGQAPKFPNPSIPVFLLACGLRQNEPETVRMVLHTCRRMAAGGIHDHLGGGFARYAVDREWLVPHFEKMLYDNAQLACLYLDAFRLTADPEFAAVTRGILSYVMRDMTHPDGGFYSAEDADSEGREGLFYCWSRDQIASLLTPAENALVVRRFGITEQGNFVDHSHPDPFPGQNVLHIADPALTPDESTLLSSAAARLLAARSRRTRPHLDDKILSSWNGLMLSAFARAAAALDDPDYLAAAVRNLDFIRRRLWDDKSLTLYHRWRDNGRDTVQLLPAYAFVLVGVIDLYQATLDPAHLEFAVRLAQGMIRRFHDSAAGDFWQSEADPNLFVRLKNDHDGAEPSGTSMAVLGLLRLGVITGRADFLSIARTALESFASRMMALPEAHAAMLLTLLLHLEPGTRVVLAGNDASPAARAMRKAAHSSCDPGRVVMGTTGPVDDFCRTLLPRDSLPTAYLCTGTLCRPPTTDPVALAAALAPSTNTAT